MAQARAIGLAGAVEPARDRGDDVGHCLPLAGTGLRASAPERERGHLV
jgi:hypothetical protein